MQYLTKDEVEDYIENDSKWISYADEALSYALEFTYLIEEDLFTELTREIKALGLMEAIL